jgi:hypothetical protein
MKNHWLELAEVRKFELVSEYFGMETLASAEPGLFPWMPVNSINEKLRIKYCKNVFFLRNKLFAMSRRPSKIFEDN